MTRKVDQSNLKNSKEFCVVPWVHMHTFPNGDVCACCLSNPEQTFGNLNNSTIEEIWNSPKIRNLRSNMLNGKKSAHICDRCYTKEDEGFQSLRTGLNEKYLHKIIPIIESTEDDGRVEEVNLMHWDFRFSNLCNLSCRSCGPGLSSSWHQDNKKYWNIQTDEPALIKLPEENNRKLLDTVLKNIDRVQSIHFAGGEPMMMEEHWIILDALKEANRRDVQIHYSTNMTRFKFGKKHVFDYWPHFADVHVAASIDDIGGRFEYIRNGGKWNVALENLQSMKRQNFKNVRLSFHPTISIFNILSFTDMVKYLWENENFQAPLSHDALFNYFIHIVHINPLTYPDYYAATVLPQDIKKQATQKLEDLIKWVHDNVKTELGYLCNTAPVQSLIDFMNAKDDSHLLPEFFNITARLDEIRNQDFWATFPELADLENY